MDEAALVEAAQAGGEDAFAQLYASYFASVYDFAVRLVRDREQAARLVEAAFLATMTAMPGLRTPASFRARLFASARDAALRHLERKPAARAGREGHEAGFDAVKDAPAASPAASLVWEGTLALDPRQLSLLDLHLRQGLDCAEIAALLGITKDNARVLLARIENAAEGRIAAFIIASLAGPDCARLTAALATVDTTTASLDLRRVADRHVALCTRCRERRSQLAPLASFTGLAAIASPPGTKERIVESLMRQWPASVVIRPRRPAAGGGQGDTVPSLPAAQESPVPRRPVLALVALGTAVALLAAVVLVPGNPLAFGLFGGGDRPSSAPGGSTPLPIVTGTTTPTRPTATGTVTPAASAAGAIVVDGSATPGAVTPTTVAARTPTATPTPPGPTRVGTPSPMPTATPVPTPTTAPCVPRLATNGISRLFLGLGGTGSFFVYDAGLCGPLAFAVSAPWWLGVTPATGSFPIAGKAEVTVTAPPGGLAEGPHDGLVTVVGVPDGGQVNVTVTVTVVGSPPEVLSTTCTATGGSWSFAAQVKDDYAVASVTLKYATENGTAAVPMSGPNGDASGDWTASIAADSNAHSFTVTARDAAGQAGSAPVAACS